MQNTIKNNFFIKKLLKNHVKKMFWEFFQWFYKLHYIFLPNSKSWSKSVDWFIRKLVIFLWLFQEFWPKYVNKKGINWSHSTTVGARSFSDQFSINTDEKEDKKLNNKIKRIIRILSTELSSINYQSLQLQVVRNTSVWIFLSTSIRL